MANLNKYEQAKRLRIDLIIFILIAALTMTSISAFNKYRSIDNLKEEITALKVQKEKVEKNNKKVAALEEEQSLKLNDGKVKQESQNFNDKFFNFNGWGGYVNQMKDLQREYPQLMNSKVVDITGTAIGIGKGPKSSYSSTFITSEEPNRIVELISQIKTTDNAEYRTQWYKVSEYENGRYDVIYAEHFK